MKNQEQTQQAATQLDSDHDGQWARKRRTFNQKLLNKIAREPRFRQALLDDAEAALRSAGLDCELLELQVLEVESQPDVAARECAPLSCVTTCTLTCRSNTCQLSVVNC